MLASIKTPSGATYSGTLTVAPLDSLVFTSQSAPTITIPFSDIKTQLKNKDGAAKVILKVKLISSDNAYQLFFTDPDQKIAVADRQNVIDTIANHLSSNDNNNDSKQNVLPAKDSSISSPNTTPVLSAPGSTHSMSEIDLTNIDKKPVYNRHRLVKHVEVKYDDFSVKQELLKNDKNLATLFKDIVLSGFISEKEFWDSRRHLLVRQAWEINQKQGPTSQLLDLRSTPSDEVSFKFTPEIIDSILEQYGAVRRAYEATVLTGKVSTKSFWERFLKSKYFKKTPGVPTRDNFFLRFEKMEEDESEAHPEGIKYNSNSLLLDLEAVEEDYERGGNEAEMPMRAGRVKESLPVIRQYNMNSDRVVRQIKDSKLKESLEKKNQNDSMNIDDNCITESDIIYMNETEIPDLRIREETYTFPLIISDRAGYLQSINIDKNIEDIQHFERLHAQKFNDDVSKWELKLYEYNANDPNCVVVENKLLREIEDGRSGVSKEDTDNVIQAKKLFSSSKELLHHYYILVSSNNPNMQDLVSKRKRVMEALKEAYEKLNELKKKSNDDDDLNALQITESILPALEKISSQFKN